MRILVERISMPNTTCAMCESTNAVSYTSDVFDCTLMLCPVHLQEMKEDEIKARAKRNDRKLFRECVRSLKKESYPDEVVSRNTMDGHCALVARKRLREPLPDCWGNDLTHDEVAVETRYGTPYSEADCKEAMKKKVSFFACTRKEHEEVLKRLSSKYELDCNEASGSPILACLYLI
jgi:hypothetical protein